MTLEIIFFLLSIFGVFANPESDAQYSYPVPSNGLSLDPQPIQYQQPQSEPPVQNILSAPVPAQPTGSYVPSPSSALDPTQNYLAPSPQASSQNYHPPLVQINQQSAVIATQRGNYQQSLSTQKQTYQQPPPIQSQNYQQQQPTQKQNYQQPRPTQKQNYQSSAPTQAQNYPKPSPTPRQNYQQPAAIPTQKYQSPTSPTKQSNQRPSQKYQAVAQPKKYSAPVSKSNAPGYQQDQQRSKSNPSNQSYKPKSLNPSNRSFKSASRPKPTQGYNVQPAPRSNLNQGYNVKPAPKPSLRPAPQQYKSNSNQLQSYQQSAPAGYNPAQEQYGPAQYNFDWTVNDEYGNNYGHQEQREGESTQGEYYVQLPDGRLQRVTYTVNGDSGFVATVSYEGEANFPQIQGGEQYKPTVSPPRQGYN